MITGKGSGSGKYTYESRSSGNISCYVSNMPEDSYSFRIAFTHNGENHSPVIKFSKREAELLWASLNTVAKTMDWKDYEPNL